jgi:tetratricopeptide (TPR) repeat protein
VAASIPEDRPPGEASIPLAADTPAGPEPAAEPGWLPRLCEGVIEGGWLVALATGPVFMNVFSPVVFEPEKAALLQTLAALMTAAWLAKVLAGGRAAAPAGAGAPGPSLAPALAAALLAAGAVLAATALSVAPALSWRGSYLRGHGAATQLAGLAVFALALAHLRTASQWRRLGVAMVTASTAVSLYGVLQAAGLDPVPWAAPERRVASTLGNPIFLAAYLLPALLVTLHEAARLGLAILRPDPGTPPRGGPVLGLALLLYALLLQAAAFWLAASRGPALGLLAGTGLAGWLGAIRLRAWALHLPASSRVPRALLRHAWLAVLAGGLLAALVLARASLPGASAARASAPPAAANPETVRVRLLLWDAGLDLLIGPGPAWPPGTAPAEDPAGPPTETPGGPRAGRALLGWGPETQVLTLGRHVPAALTRYERPDAVPDRLHNETLDVLATTGLLGWLGWTGLQVALLHAALVGLGFLPSARARRLAGLALGAGALLGAAAPLLLPPLRALAGVGSAAGLLGAVAAVALAAATRRAGAAPPAGPPGPRDALLLVLTAAATAHLVETQVGIAVVATRLAYWVLAAALLAAARGHLAPAPAPPAARGAGGVEGLVLAAVGLPLVHALAGAWARPPAPDGGPGFATAAAALALLLLATGLTAAALAAGPGPGQAAPAVPPPLAAAVTGAALLAAGGALQVVWLRGSAPLAGPHALPERVAVLGSGHLDVVHATAAGLAVAVGVLLAGLRGHRQAAGGPRRARAGPVAAALALGLGAAWTAHRHVLPPRRADAHAHAAQVLQGRGRPDLAGPAIQAALRLDPAEPRLWLLDGRTALDAAAAAGPGETRRVWLARAEASLERARDLAPLDPDHAANVARGHLTRADLGESPDASTEVRRALVAYGEALRLRPHFPPVALEVGLALERLGQHDAARARVEQAGALAPRWPEPRLALAGLHRAAAARAEGAGQAGAARARRADAARVLDDLLAERPGLPGAERLRAAVLADQGRRQEAVAAYGRLLARHGDDLDAHWALARLHLAAGRPDLGLPHAEAALRLAPPASRDAVARTWAALQAAAAPGPARPAPGR